MSRYSLDSRSRETMLHEFKADELRAEISRRDVRDAIIEDRRRVSVICTHCRCCVAVFEGAIDAEVPDHPQEIDCHFCYQRLKFTGPIAENLPLGLPRGGVTA